MRLHRCWISVGSRGGIRGGTRGGGGSGTGGKDGTGDTGGGVGIRGGGVFLGMTLEEVDGESGDTVSTLGPEASFVATMVQGGGRSR